MDSLTRDVRYAVRSLLRMRGAALVAILALALGIGATTTMFSVVYAALLRPLPFEEADRLVIVYNTRVTQRDGLERLRWSHARARDLQAAAVSFDHVATLTATTVNISGRGDPEQIDGEIVSPDYFRALRIAPAAGRTFTSEEDTVGSAQPIAVLSDRLWRRRYDADPTIIGATIRVNDAPLTIIGIMPPGVTGLTGKADIWFPPTLAARLTYADYLTTPQHFISVVARLKEAWSVDHANAELRAIGSRFADQASLTPATWSAEAVPIGPARIDPGLRRSALLMLAAAMCVLLIACVNVASLLLARASTRRREIAIRLAVGASRPQIARQLLTESLLLATLAGVCGVLAASWGASLWAQTAPAVIASGRSIPVGAFAAPALDLRVLLFALAATAGTVLVFGLVPALGASKADASTALKDDERGGGRRRGLATLVISEVAVAVLLLAGSALLLESFARIERLRKGFDAERVFTFWIRPPASTYPPAAGPATIDRLLRSIESVPGVESAAVDRCTPFMACARTNLFVSERPIDRMNAPTVGRHYISADYFRTLGIALRAGRVLTAADREGSPPVAVINESGARRLWPDENPIGKRVFFGTTTGPFSDPAHAVEVVGVVADVKYEGAERLESSLQAEFYTSYLQFAFPDTMAMVKTRGAPLPLVPALRRAVASVDPALPISDAMTLDDRVALATARPRFNAALLSAFAAAALLLAALGVYGVLSYSVASRMREIGVRVAIGANRARILGLVLSEGLRLAGAGAAIGVAAAIAAGRLLQGILFDAPASDPRLLACAAVLMLIVASLATFLPARRASAVDPIVVLRDP